jgi:hypothetical protein
MLDSNGESGEPLRNALLAVDHDTVRQHHLGLQHPSDQHEQPPIANPLSELCGQPLVADEIEELLQIKICHPPVAIPQIAGRPRRSPCGNFGQVETVV